MRVREAVQDDAETIAELADLPVAAATHLIVERTVRVACEADDGGDEASGDPTLRGFVAFDARPGVVHVTQLAGDRAAVAQLLDEPAGFADSEGMTVEVVVPESAPDIREAVEEFGFEPAGDGPVFDGESTRRYRLD